MEEKPIEYFYHIIDGRFLESPVRIWLQPSGILSMSDDFIYRRAPLVGSSYKTVCVEVEGIGQMPLVCGSNLETIEAFTISYGGHNLGNKYFTKSLFIQYMDAWACDCENSCSSVCFLLLSGCRALVNGEGLLV